MFRKLLFAASTTLALGACDVFEEPTKSPADLAPLEEVVDQRDADPEAFHANIQSAMEEIPNDLLPQFQLLFACEVRKNNRLPNPQPVDAKYIRALTEFLKQNPTAGNYCRQ